MAFPTAEQAEADEFFLAPYDPEGFECGGTCRQVHVRRGEAHGLLFRIEPAALPTILVQSARKPDWGYAFANAGYLLARAPPEPREFDPRACFCRAGARWRFRLRANPTRKCIDKGRRHALRAADEQSLWLERKGQAGGFRVVLVPLCGNGSRAALTPGHAGLATPTPPAPAFATLDEARAYRSVNPGRQGNQTIRRALRCGWSVAALNAALAGNTETPERWRAGAPSRLSLLSVLFEGVLEVTDPDAFHDTLVQGIGSGKAFGFGLLSLARAPT
jgi:CRISPR system Cascade subunit CasE